MALLPPFPPMGPEEDEVDQKEKLSKKGWREKLWRKDDNTPFNIAMLVRFIALGVAIGLLILIIQDSLDYQSDSSTGNSRDSRIVSVITPTPVATGTPSIASPKRNYKAGELRKSTSTVHLCWATTDVVTKKGVSLCSILLLKFGDKVEIQGFARYLSGEWYWPIKIVEGSVYTQGEIWWVSEKAELVLTTKFELPYLQFFLIGDTALLDYNFLIRDSAAGTPYVDENGRQLLFFGGDRVKILDGPEWVSGHNWCYVEDLEYHPETTINRAWIPCEFQVEDKKSANS